MVDNIVNFLGTWGLWSWLIQINISFLFYYLALQDLDHEMENLVCLVILVLHKTYGLG